MSWRNLFNFCFCLFSQSDSTNVTNLLGEDFSSTVENETIDNNTLNSDLLNLQWPVNNADLFNSNFMPSNFIKEGSINFTDTDLLQDHGDDDSNKMEIKEIKENVAKKNLSDKQVSWLSLFAELDPLANQDIANASGDNA